MKEYSSYKDSEIEWIGEIPTHWNSVKLKFLGFLYSGLSGKKGDDFRKDDSPFNKNYIPFTNIANNFEIDPRRLDSVEIFENENQNAVEKNDLFFLMSSENYEDIGKTAVLKDDIPETYLNSFCKGFRLFNEDEVDASFLNYLLSGDIYRKILSIEAKGFTRINLQMGKIQNLPVILPLIQEQSQIANYLDYKTGLIHNVISQKEQLIENLKEKRQAIINEAVTKGLNRDVPLIDSGIEWLGEIPEHWEIVKLRYLADITTGAKDTENREDDGEYPFFVRSQTIERISTYSFDGEAILTAGDGVGVCKVWHYINGKFDFHQRVYMMHNFRRITGIYLFNFLKENFINEVLKLSAKSTVDSLRRPMFLDFPVAVPPEEEQQDIIELLSTKQILIDQSIQKILLSIEKLKEYRQSLISEVVTGKIDVRDWKPKSPKQELIL